MRKTKGIAVRYINKAKSLLTFNRNNPEEYVLSLVDASYKIFQKEQYQSNIPKFSSFIDRLNSKNITIDEAYDLIRKLCMSHTNSGKSITGGIVHLSISEALRQLDFNIEEEYGDQRTDIAILSGCKPCAYVSVKYNLRERWKQDAYLVTKEVPFYVVVMSTKDVSKKKVVAIRNTGLIPVFPADSQIDGSISINTCFAEIRKGIGASNEKGQNN